ncbi:MAG: tetratricopeptide repeat protein [Gammaproteobacteria bacterium]
MKQTVHSRVIARPLVTVCLLAAGLLAAGAGIAADLQQGLADIQHRWAEANYRLEGGAQKDAFEQLAKDAEALVAAHPDRAEPLVWQGIVLSTYAGVKGPFGAMKLAKQSRDALHAAEKLDPSVLHGSVYTSLGALYYKVPGGFIGFGDKDRARDYLEKALTMNPDGIDPNYFYGEFLFEEKEYDAARRALQHALEATPRPDRTLADEGRRAEIRELLSKVEKKAG